MPASGLSDLVAQAYEAACDTAGMSGFPTIGFGPGHEKFAHAPNEQVEIEHLVRASAFYVALVDEFARTPNEEAMATDIFSAVCFASAWAIS